MVIIARVFFTTLIIFISASFADKLDTKQSKCAKKFKESSFKIANTTAFAVTQNSALLYSNRVIKSKYIKHDPFLGLYLVSTPKNMKYTFDIVPHSPKKLRSMSNSGEYDGKIIKKQIGLNSLAYFSSKGQKSSLITARCCQLNGFMTSFGRLIERDYIDRFLSMKSVDYADVGIRIKQGLFRPIVDASDPFFPNNHFKEGDEIFKMDGKLTKSAPNLMKKILFSGSLKKHNFEVIRNGERIILNVKSYQRKGGGLLSDSFLEPRGITLNKELNVIRVEKNSAIEKLGVHLGDKLLRIGKHEISSLSQIRSALSAEQSLKKRIILILFERKSFQFFIQMPKG